MLGRPGVSAAVVAVALTACGEDAARDTEQPPRHSSPSASGATADTADAVHGHTGDATGSTGHTGSDDRCTLDARTDGPWFASVTAFEHFDSRRTHTFRCAEFSGTSTGANRVTDEVFDGTWPTPYNLVVREPGELFVHGGCYGELPGAPGTFVAAIDADTGRERWRTQLLDAPAHPEKWNFVGVVGVHRDGFVYDAWGTRLTKLDPRTGAVLAEAVLPISPDSTESDTTYNGFNGLSDGRLVTKSIHRQAGCQAQGTAALFACPCPTCVPNSVLAVVDPESMAVLAQVETTEPTGGRLTAASFEGRDYVYLAGLRSVFRYVWDGATIALDPTWGPIDYLLPGQTPAPAVAVCGGWVLLQTNAFAARTPMSVVAIAQSDAQVASLQPFAGEGGRGEVSAHDAMLSCDPENDRVYVIDGGYGLVAGLRLDPATGALTEVWQVEQPTKNFSTLIGPPEARVHLSTESSGAQGEVVVWREAATGRELARSGALPTMSPGALVTPGPDGSTYYFGVAGSIHALTVAPLQ